MLKRWMLLLALLFAVLPLAVAAGPKTYQVTGPVLAITGNVITVQKGAEKWEIALDPSTKTTGDLKVGAKVTIQYQMTATTITVKPATAAAPAGKSN
jgi:hypothetical protein